MCARCPVGGRWPSYPWPQDRPRAGDLGPAPDLGTPNYGKAPPIRWFPPAVTRKPRWWQGRSDDRPKFITDGR